MKNWFKTGQTITFIAACWAIFDAILHVVVDEVEPLRIAGNIITVAVAGIVRVLPGAKAAAMVCGLAALVVLVLNVVWAVDFGSLPVIAIVLFGGAVAMLAGAAVRYSQLDA